MKISEIEKILADVREQMGDIEVRIGDDGGDYDSPIYRYSVKTTHEQVEGKFESKTVLILE